MTHTHAGLMALVRTFGDAAFAYGECQENEDEAKEAESAARAAVESYALALVAEATQRLRDDRDCEKRLRKDAEERREEMAEALAIAVRQNEHDMIMTGDELRDCRRALDGRARASDASPAGATKEAT